MRLKRDEVEEVVMFEDEIIKRNKEEEEQRFRIDQRIRVWRSEEGELESD